MTKVPTKADLILSIKMWQRIIANEIDICQRNHTSINLMYDVLGRSELMYVIHVARISIIVAVPMNLSLKCSMSMVRVESARPNKSKVGIKTLTI